MIDPHNCAAKGCTSTTSGYSRFCRRHGWQYYRAGDPNGRILRKRKDLGPYREIAAAAVMRNMDHPGIAGAVRWLESLMDWGKEYQGHGVKGELAKNLRRLRRDGATGEAMLTRIAAVAFYAEANKRTWEDGVCHTVNLGHHCLYTTPYPPRYNRQGKPQRASLKHTVKLEMGKVLRETIGLLLVKLWEADEERRTRDARAAQAINAAVGDRPLE